MHIYNFPILLYKENVWISTAAAFPSYLIIPTKKLCSLKFSPCLKTPLGRKRNVFCVKATSSADTDHTQQQPTSSSESKSPLSIVFDVPRIIWRQTLRSLGYFGFGRRSIWEGGVGLFLLSGTVLLTLSLAWLKGFRLRSKFWKYLAVFEFDQASGMCTGAPVRIKRCNCQQRHTCQSFPEEY